MNEFTQIQKEIRQNYVPKPPRMPTDAEPGSEERLLAYQDRFARGEAIFHSHDLGSGDHSDS